ncbi:MAG: hypothetical protein RSE32_07355 [Comamonas sp.]|uniref:hypothetical protein n=1 Tax=Comamonas sp. TaxID=34028 RepID=UPI002FCA591C
MSIFEVGAMAKSKGHFCTCACLRTAYGTGHFWMALRQLTMLLFSSDVPKTALAEKLTKTVGYKTPCVLSLFFQFAHPLKKSEKFHLFFTDDVRLTRTVRGHA